MMAEVKGLGWNQGYLPSYNSSAPYFIHEAQVTSEQRRLNVSIRYDFGLWKKIVEFTATGGKIKPMVGVGRRPRMVYVPRGYTYSPDETVRKERGGMGPMTMVSYDLRMPEDQQRANERARMWDVRGKIVSEGLLTGLWPKHKTNGYGLKPAEVRRYVVERRPLHEAQYRAVPMWPAN